MWAIVKTNINDTPISYANSLWQSSPIGGVYSSIRLGVRLLTSRHNALPRLLVALVMYKMEKLSHDVANETNRPHAISEATISISCSRL